MYATTSTSAPSSGERQRASSSAARPEVVDDHLHHTAGFSPAAVGAGAGSMANVCVELAGARGSIRRRGAARSKAAPKSPASHGKSQRVPSFAVSPSRLYAREGGALS